MGFMRVQHTFNAKSGLAEDAIVNTFHFTSSAPADGAAAVVLGPLIRNFYDVTATGAAGPINGALANTAFATNRRTLKFYDMMHVKPRVPVYSWTPTDNIPNNTLNAFPAEVALCLSYRANPVSGGNAKRERGRIYLGPISGGEGEVQASTGFSRPSLILRNILLRAGKKLQDDAAAAGWFWVVYSPTARAAAGAEAAELAGTAPIWELLVDDAWDTQRRRGPRRLSRETLLV